MSLFWSELIVSGPTLYSKAGRKLHT